MRPSAARTAERGARCVRGGRGVSRGEGADALSVHAGAGYRRQDRRAGWLLGRERAQQRHGDAFDLKAWHMQALSLGSLGLDDLVDELSKL
ncbi:DUF885 family protein [Streptomyces griseorubiginosus]|uniref:DUF885 family protein n=1 Tax=Streptomyces griseorubiginosus TaxID=67304 RepID=UPI000D14C5CD